MPWGNSKYQRAAQDVTSVFADEIELESATDWQSEKDTDPSRCTTHEVAVLLGDASFLDPGVEELKSRNRLKQKKRRCRWIWCLLCFLLAGGAVAVGFLFTDAVKAAATTAEEEAESVFQKLKDEFGNLTTADKESGDPDGNSNPDLRVDIGKGGKAVGGTKASFPEQVTQDVPPAAVESLAEEDVNGTAEEIPESTQAATVTEEAEAGIAAVLDNTLEDPVAPEEGDVFVADAAHGPNNNSTPAGSFAAPAEGEAETNFPAESLGTTEKVEGEDGNEAAEGDAVEIEEVETNVTAESPDPTGEMEREDEGKNVILDTTGETEGGDAAQAAATSENWQAEVAAEVPRDTENLQTAEVGEADSTVAEEAAAAAAEPHEEGTNGLQEDTGEGSNQAVENLGTNVGTAGTTGVMEAEEDGLGASTEAPAAAEENSLADTLAATETEKADVAASSIAEVAVGAKDNSNPAPVAEGDLVTTEEEPVEGGEQEVMVDSADERVDSALTGGNEETVASNSTDAADPVDGNKTLSP